MNPRSQAAPSINNQQSTIDNPRINNPRVLVVDDEERNLRLMEAMLLPLGYEVTLAENGLKALDSAREDPPDVILLDVMMPGMDGFEVAERLKQDAATQMISVVMVTALKETKARIRALRAGADDFLSKPVDMAELQARVRSSVKVKAYHDHMLNYQKELEAEVAERTEQLRKTFEKLKKVSLGTIYRLSRAAEYKDENTAAHILRMSNYAEAVARKMGLNEKIVENILYAAGMHDVGKIGIPDRILMKPGKLDSAEWKLMRQHSVMGQQILKGADSGFIKLAEVIAATHHEKWDGTGYPKGLKGKQIPLAGRITAIADVFDALTSTRLYKEPFSLEKAFEIIREGRGSHFDPKVVDAFFAARDEILTIRAKYQDGER